MVKVEEESFEVTSGKGDMLFSADEKKVALGVEKLRVTGMYHVHVSKEVTRYKVVE